VPAELDETAQLGRQLREFRLDRDLTFVKLAVLTDISKSVLQRIETGRARLHARTIRKLKRFLEAASRVA
jgi:transcriptional regulator with XRE-family HTH domain